MLLAVILELTAQRSCALPPGLGRANYAQALAWLRGLDAGLSAAVHDAQAKPLTCSTLLDAPVQDGQVQVAAGKQYRVRLTTLTPELTRVVARQLNVAPPGSWPLQGCGFDVTGIVCNDEVDALSGATMADDLAARAFLGGGSLPAAVTLEYLSPVAFKSADMHMPLPLPGLVWGSLAARWNALYPAHRIEEGARRFAEEAVALSYFRLNSEVAWLSPEMLVIGATGRATYSAMTDDRYWLGVFNLLADFAFYAGVGVKTAVGCGQCRRRQAGA